MSISIYEGLFTLEQLKAIKLPKTSLEDDKYQIATISGANDCFDKTQITQLTNFDSASFIGGFTKILSKQTITEDKITCFVRFSFKAQGDTDDFGHSVIVGYTRIKGETQDKFSCELYKNDDSEDKISETQYIDLAMTTVSQASRIISSEEPQEPVKCSVITSDCIISYNEKTAVPTDTVATSIVDYCNKIGIDELTYKDGNLNWYKPSSTENSYQLIITPVGVATFTLK